MDLVPRSLFQAGELWGNTSDFQCSGNQSRPSCSISQSELVKRDSIALVRAVFSVLSIIGTFSIIISVIVKRRILSPKVHPIFMLSVADFCLAFLWTVGGGVWFAGSSSRFNSDRDGCFAVLLATVILECVTVNLTCVYALLAYSSIRQKDFSNVYSLFEKDFNKYVWKPWITILVYIIAWIVPVALILPPFFALDARYGYVKQADKCTCWCIPFFGNILPHANSLDKPTALYVYELSKFVLVYSVMIGMHYVFGFTLLLVVYCMVLYRISKMRKVYRENMSHHNLYGATEAIIVKGQSQARTKVIIFLTVFLITGFFNAILSGILIHYAETKLSGIRNSTTKVYHHVIPPYVMTAYILQSVTIPLQGFLNAIIYGWTRQDFVKAIRTGGNSIGIGATPSQAQGSTYQHHEVEHETHTSTDSLLISGQERRVNRSMPNSPGMLQTLSENSDSD